MRTRTGEGQPDRNLTTGEHIWEPFNAEQAHCILCQMRFTSRANKLLPIGWTRFTCWHSWNTFHMQSKHVYSFVRTHFTRGIPWVKKSWSNAPEKEENGTSDLWWLLTPVGTIALGSPTGIIALSSTDASITCWEKPTAYSFTYFSTTMAYRISGNIGSELNLAVWQLRLESQN